MLLTIRLSGNRRFYTIFCSLLLLALLSSCSQPAFYHQLTERHAPLFIDDFDKKSLLTAVDRHLHYLKASPDKISVSKPAISTHQEAIQSLLTFRRIISENLPPYQLDTKIRETFTVYQAAGREKTPDEILLTGYYTPVFSGSLTKEGPFRYPLLSVPTSLITRKNLETGKMESGRLDEEKGLTPFWTRAEIENGLLSPGNELVYLADPLDSYLLHIQGSGKIRLQDGSIKSVGYAASNGHRYESLGKLFVDRGIMKLKDVSIPAIRNYFAAHPDQITEMLNHNPRYIFFTWTQSHGPPSGSTGIPLTPGRSVAVDHTVFPTTAVGYLISRKPVLDGNGNIIHWKTFSRFVLPQDSGAAIKGSGRIDLFLGDGHYAEIAAGHMKEEGKFFLLVQNNAELE